MFTLFVLAWAIGGLLGGIGLWALISWLRKKNMKTLWYDWLIAAIGLFLFLFSVQNSYGSVMERYVQAGWMFLLFPGLVGIIMMGIVALQVQRRNRAKA